MKKILTMSLVLVLPACAGTQQRNAEMYRQAAIDRQVEAKLQADKQREQHSNYLAQAQACADDTCRVAIAGFAALASSGTQNQVTQAPPIPYERDGAAKFRDVLSGVVPIVSTLAGAAVNFRQSEINRDIQLGQYQFLGSAINSTTTAATNIATAGPRIDVGGDYISGTQHIGDTIAGDGNATRGGRIGDDVGRDQISGTQTITQDSGNGNRTSSPDNSGNGGDCASGSGGAGSGTPTLPGTGGPSVGCTAGDGGRP